MEVACVYRLETMLQATADAAALAAAVDLPNQGQALVAAKKYAKLNMPKAVHGEVLDPADVQFGAWGVETGIRAFGHFRLAPETDLRGSESG